MDPDALADLMDQLPQKRITLSCVKKQSKLNRLSDFFAEQPPPSKHSRKYPSESKLIPLRFKNKLAQKEEISNSSDKQLSERVKKHLIMRVEKYATWEYDDVIKKDYMAEGQPDLCIKMRSILVDWIMEVMHKTGTSHRVFHMTLHIIDRYLSVQEIPRSKL